MSEINKELFQKILDQIREHPESHDQGHWERPTACGTTRCIAGWAVHLHALNTLDEVSPFDSAHNMAQRLGYTCVEQAGAALLGLNSWEANNLFYGAIDEEAVEMVENYALKGREWQ